MDHDAYRKKRKRCQLLTMFPGLRVPTGAGQSYVAVPHWDTQARELHHVIPRSIAHPDCRDDLRNLIHLHPTSHQFVTEFSKPGLVLCLFAKWEMNELDVAFLSKCMSKNLAAYLDSDDMRSQCQRWTWLERFRLELLGEISDD